MFKTRDGMIRVISATAAVTALTIGGIAVAPMLSGCSAISQLDKKGGRGDLRRRQDYRG